MTDFETALQYWAEESPANLRKVKDLRAEAMDKILAGGGELTTLLSGSLNGKSYSRQITASASQLFTSCTAVLKAIDGVSVDQLGCLEVDFSQINGR